jgi:hypothetical protein
MASSGDAAERSAQEACGRCANCLLWPATCRPVLLRWPPWQVDVEFEGSGRADGAEPAPRYQVRLRSCCTGAAGDRCHPLTRHSPMQPCPQPLGVVPAPSPLVKHLPISCVTKAPYP